MAADKNFEFLFTISVYLRGLASFSSFDELDYLFCRFNIISQGVSPNDEIWGIWQKS
jgi:hypothetical protein